MKILVILFLAFGVLLILIGISIFTPLFSWLGKRLNSSSSTSVNYNQPGSILATSIFMGIYFFIFGLFITIASAALLNIWNTQTDSDLSVPQSVSSKPKIFETPMVPAPSINPKNNSSVSKYRLDCPSDADGLNMRKQAGLNTEIILLIPCDAIVIQETKQRYYQDGIEWHLVKYQQNIGWVTGKYLKPQETKPNKTNFLSELIAKKIPRS